MMRCIACISFMFSCGCTEVLLIVWTVDTALSWVVGAVFYFKTVRCDSGVSEAELLLREPFEWAESGCLTTLTCLWPPKCTST